MSRVIDRTVTGLKCNMDTHIRRHTKNKIYICIDDPLKCNSAFCDKSSLNRHRKGAHKYKPNRRRPRKSRKSRNSQPSESAPASLPSESSMPVHHHPQASSMHQHPSSMRHHHTSPMHHLPPSMHLHHPPSMHHHSSSMYYHHPSLVARASSSIQTHSHTISQVPEYFPFGESSSSLPQAPPMIPSLHSQGSILFPGSPLVPGFWAAETQMHNRHMLGIRRLRVTRPLLSTVTNTGTTTVTRVTQPSSRSRIHGSLAVKPPCLSLTDPHQINQHTIRPQTIRLQIISQDSHFRVRSSIIVTGITREFINMTASGDYFGGTFKIFLSLL